MRFVGQTFLLILSYVCVAAFFIPETVFAASPPTANLKIWLEANSLNLTNGASVSAWPDQSGNGYNATSTGSAEPTYETNQINGLPALNFSGNQSLTIGTGFASQPFTVFVVEEQTSETWYPAFVSEWNGASTGNLILGDDHGSPQKIAISKEGLATASSNLSEQLSQYSIVSFGSSGISGGNVTVVPYQNSTQGSWTPPITGFSVEIAVGLRAATDLGAFCRG
jgi:hypothetical protein